MTTPPVPGLPPGRVHRMSRWGEDVLHAPTTPVTAFDAQLAQLVADMVATMAAADGVGLAATQIGVPLAVFVYDVRARSAARDELGEDGTQRHDALGHRLGPFAGVVCNPRLTIPADAPDQESVKDTEGCLSLPGAFVPTVRSWVASVTGVDHTGQPVQVFGTGLLARCLQHETDHLRGIVLADRLPRWRRHRLHAQADRLAGTYPDDWPVTPTVDAD